MHKGNIDHYPGLRAEVFTGNRKDYIDGSSHTDFGLPYYEDYLGINLPDFAGDKVLDIGGAPGGRFAAKAKETGVDLTTINAAEQEVLDAKKKGNIENPTAVAYAQELPFDDDTFDAEFAHATVPAYLPKYVSEYKTVFDEMIRTTKHGGKIYIFPIIGTIYDSAEFKSLIVDDLADKGDFKFESLGRWPVEGIVQDFYRLIVKVRKQ